MIYLAVSLSLALALALAFGIVLGSRFSYVFNYGFSVKQLISTMMESETGNEIDLKTRKLTAVILYASHMFWLSAFVDQSGTPLVLLYHTTTTTTPTPTRTPAPTQMVVWSNL